MHYYSKNIGDYAKKAGRLSMLEHGAYNLLLDACHDREQFPTEEEAIDWCWCRSQEEIDAVKFVLFKFFDKDDGGRYIQKRIKETLDNYHEKAKTNSENGKKGGRPKGSKSKAKKTQPLSKKTQSVNSGFENKANETQPPQNKSLTNNHKPPTNNQEPETTIEKNICPPPANVRLIFDYWVSVMGKNAKTKFSDERKRKIKQRLKSFTADQIKLAIDGCSRSDWHMGDNPQEAIYDDIELICRNDTNLEKFIAMAHRVSPKERQKQAYDDFIGVAPNVIEGDFCHA